MIEKGLFRCLNCGHLTVKWLGRCPECGEWNSFAEAKDKFKNNTLQSVFSIPLNEIELKESLRLDSGLDELNRVLGGGLMNGSAVLLGGEPGIGKSTLMLLVAASIKTEKPVLFISGEESAIQLKMRAKRLGLAENERIEVSNETDLELILALLDKVKPGLVIIDSIQTVRKKELGPIFGAVNQMKYATQMLVDWIKQNSCSLFLIGHVTKEGYLAGPKLIEHMVDTVLHFETADQDLRIIRALKNRFGSVDEIGIFEMTDQGLFQVKEPGKIFLQQRKGPFPPGIVITPVFEGSRVLVLEIQSLIAPARGTTPRVFSDRIDPRLVFKAQGVLEKHSQVSFADCDVYVNVAGGLSVKEVGIELPLCLSLFSSRLGLSFPAKTVVCGEVSLAGEIRSVKGWEKRLRTASDLGFEEFISAVPKIEFEAICPEVKIKAVETIAEALKQSFKT